MYSAFLFTLVLIPLAISSNIEEPETRQLPVGAYAPYPYYSPFVPQYGYANPNGYANPKNFFGLVSTSTSTSTSVVVTTCTVSTSSICSGRRRRGITIDENEDIVASAPVRVEPTQIVSMDELDREKREPNPQYYYVPAPFTYPSHYDISPSFEKNVQRPYGYPAPYTPYVAAPQGLPADQRFFFNVFVVTTITTVSTATSTSRPSCSTSSNFNQC